jgi:hypothetical protein
VVAGGRKQVLPRRAAFLAWTSLVAAGEFVEAGDEVADLLEVDLFLAGHIVVVGELEEVVLEL